MRRRYWIALAVLVLAIVAVGSAVAATRFESPSTRSQAIINDAAGRLHVSPAQLSSALQQAADDQVDAAVAAGRLTKAQGDALKARINSGQAPLVGGLPFAFGLGARAFGGAGPKLAFPFPLGPRGLIAAGLHVVTSYLGITAKELRTELGNGKSLAQIASDHDKTAAGLVAALVSATKTRLDNAVTAKYLSSSQETAILDKLPTFFDSLVNHTPPPLAHFGFSPGLGFGLGLLYRAPLKALPVRPFRSVPFLAPRGVPMRPLWRTPVATPHA
jgi:hypothetical protein